MFQTKLKAKTFPPPSNRVRSIGLRIRHLNSYVHGLNSFVPFAERPIRGGSGPSTNACVSFVVSASILSGMRIRGVDYKFIDRYRQCERAVIGSQFASINAANARVPVFKREPLQLNENFWNGLRPERPNVSKQRWRAAQAAARWPTRHGAAPD